MIERSLSAAAGRFRVSFIAVITAAAFGCSGVSLEAESCADNLSPQTVILDEFEAKDATVADVLEALTLLVERLTRQSYKPNFVIVGPEIGELKVSLSMKRAPLSDALDQIGQLPGVVVTYRSNQTVIFSHE